MLVDDFCKNINEDIPTSFYDVLPRICAEKTCGYPMVMSESLNSLQCSNPFCVGKLTYRLYELLNSLGIDYITKQEIKEYLVNNNIKNIFAIFSYRYQENNPFSSKTTKENSLDLQENLGNCNTFTLCEYVSLANLPFLQDSIISIFEHTTDLFEFYDKLHTSGLSYLQDILSLSDDNTLSVQVLKIFDILITYEMDLKEGLNFVNVL